MTMKAISEILSIASWLMIGALIATTSCYDDETTCNNKNRHSLETSESSILECGPEFKNRCQCQMACYNGHHQYVVNCTNSNFNDTKPLEHLPNGTEVLIFTGNNLERLPSNVFGELDRSVPSLRIIDMSNNKIREILDNTYQHVQTVERLILDFNVLSVDSLANHPRVFSNFISLLELHLIDAFEVKTTGGESNGVFRSTDLVATLHDVFVNSNLTRLTKLHLEQNEISEFRDRNVFCELPNLLDLFLGDNDLMSIHFNLSCLHNLRFLDLHRNNFKRVMQHDLKSLDRLAERNQSVMIDLTGNHFTCSRKLKPFIKWMKSTKVFVRNQNTLSCWEHGQQQVLKETK